MFSYKSITGLFKVWSEQDFQWIKEGIENKYPYAHRFKSGLVGSGCCLFAKYPIIETFCHRFSLNGYPHQIHRGDWFGGKLVGLAVLDYNGIKINVYVTHVKKLMLNQNFSKVSLFLLLYFYGSHFCFFLAAC